MNVLLANPPCRIDIDEKYERFFVRAGSRWPFSTVKLKTQRIDYAPFPFYLAYTAALLKKEQIPVQVIDAIPLNLTKEQFIEKVLQTKSEIILFETATPTIEHDILLAKVLKELTNSKIVITGAHATVFAQEIMESCPEIDFIILNEYEFTFLELVKNLIDKKYNEIERLPGLAYRKNNQVIVNKSSKLIEPLDRLPFPARELFPSNDIPKIDFYWDAFCQFRPALQMHASRGCPFDCNFCLWNQVFYARKKYRVFSPERIVDEMEHLVGEYKAKEIYFDDDSFTINKNHVLAICEEIKKRKLKVYWSCMGDAMVTDREMLKVMASAGCIGMKFGVESADEHILKEIGKPIDLEKVKAVAKWCAELGIKTHATFTFGALSETIESIRKTINFAKELDVDSVQFSITVPFPGTRLFEEARNRKLLISDSWLDYDGARSSVIQYPYLEKATLEQIYCSASGVWLLHKFKNPKWLLRQMRNIYRILKGQGLSGIFDKSRRVIELIKIAQKGK